MHLVQVADETNQPIFPEYRSPSEWPWPLFLAVSESRRILSYFTELGKDQRPPKGIWHSVYKCNKWIEDHMPGKASRDTGMIELDESDIQ